MTILPRTNFEVFNESQRGIMDDLSYQESEQRLNGVEMGVADPALHNKLYRQTSVMVAAIAQVLVDRGFDALDNDVNDLARAVALGVGMPGQIMYATFDIDFETGNLIMTTPDGYRGPDFRINQTTGNLEVMINGD